MEDMKKCEGGGCGKCGCFHHKMGPLLVVLFGLLFLLGNLNLIAAGTVSITWPILVLIGGLIKLTKGMCKCC